MSHSITRLPRNTSINLLAGMTQGVEYGFLAAGITVALLALLESFIIVVGWISAL